MTGFKSKKQAAMNKREMTPWFPASTPPDRIGVYQVKSDVQIYSKWDGKQWTQMGYSVESASKRQWGSIAMYSTKEPAFWRGFTHEQ